MTQISYLSVSRHKGVLKEYLNRKWQRQIIIKNVHCKVRSSKWNIGDTLYDGDRRRCNPVVLQ